MAKRVTIARLQQEIEERKFYLLNVEKANEELRTKLAIAEGTLMYLREKRERLIYLLRRGEL